MVSFGTGHSMTLEKPLEGAYKASAPPKEECNLTQADILFVLDSSGSVSNPSFKTMMTFVSEIVEGFDIGNNKVRVGVIIFSSTTAQKIYLDSFYEKAVLKNAISKIQRISGGTNTGDALLKARTVSLQPNHGDRPNVPNIVIVITDGKSQDRAYTSKRAAELRRSGAVVFSIGIGRAVGITELKAIATGPDTNHVFRVNNFKALESIKKELATKTCEAKEYTYPPEIPTIPPTQSTTYTVPPTETTCNETLADIIFALDTSASVSMSDFKTMLKFVGQLIRTFDIGKDNVRVGVVTYSGNYVLQFHLNKYFNINDLLNAISRVKYLAGSTNTAAALRYIRTTSFLSQNGNREDVPNIVIVITDGKSNVPASTAIEAAKLKRLSTVFSIGIGKLVGAAELKAIATDEHHVFTVYNYAALTKIKHALAVKACEAGKEPDVIKCPAKADIVFVLDSSGSIGKKNFHKILKFVQTISKSFQVSPDEVQIGVDTFDAVTRTEFTMNKYKDSYSVLEAIGKISSHSGLTYMGKALKRLREHSMTTAAGARPNVTHIGILITDGKPNGPLDVMAEAKKVQDAGIRLFALGIGPGVNYKQLESIANKPSNRFVFKAENFDSLKSIAPLLSQESCKVAPEKEEIVCTLAADIVFVVDSSASVGQHNFETMLSFINSLVGKFEIGPQAMQVGMVRYNSRNFLEFNLNKYSNITELKNAINNVKYTPGNTATGSAISFMHYNMFARASGYRVGVPKIAVVITDGRSQQTWKTREESKAAQRDNIMMFAIGITSHINKAELASIASKPVEKHMISLKSFLALESIVNSLANKTCKVIPKDSKPLTCEDRIKRCHEFTTAVCTDYPRWSHDFCPEYCGLCFTSTECIDESDACPYIKEKNCVDNPAWSRENCAKTCGFCGDKGNKTDIGDRVYACSYKGRKYKTGESWTDGCAYECSCLDAQRGMFSCWNRCPVYYKLPPQCKLLNIGNNCCKEPVCNFQGKLDRATGHKKGKRFGVDVCIYDGKEYYQGQGWSIGCEAECVCKNANTGFWICTSKCPSYQYLPPSCHLVKKAGQCCEEVKCEFTIDFGKFKGHGKVVGKANHVTDPPCVDKRPCAELGANICHAKDLEFWVVEHCPRYCNKCPTPSVPHEGACMVDEKIYKVGQTWRQSCSLACECEDGQHGIARCIDKCATFTSLPANCQKVKIAGECCEQVACNDSTLVDSQKLNNTIGGVAASNQTTSSIQKGCMYRGRYYEPNKIWNDGCDWICKCTDGNEGTYECTHRCPTFKNLPPFCHMENFPGELCCQTPVCTANSSIILVPSNGKGIIGNGKVTDPIKGGGCVYGNQTYQEGENWIDECNYFCNCLDGQRGMYSCKERCEKVRYVPDGCRVVNDPNDDCCETLKCDVNSTKPSIQPTPAIIGSCYYKGKAYSQGETWDDECSWRCFCEDAQVGYYRCINRCLSFAGIPGHCDAKSDPKDPACCKIFDCKDQDKPHGLIGIKHGFGKALQPDNKYKDKCVYKQQFYEQGETWTDGCEEQCECLNAKEGRYRCRARCARYYSLPNKCTLLPPSGSECCETLNCTKPLVDCKDESEMCGNFGKDICTNEYKDFAIKFCRKTCGTCALK